MNYLDLLKEPVIITEGAVLERLKRDTTCSLDDHVIHGGLIYDEKRKTELTKIFKSYVDIAKEKDLPIILYSVTWRTNVARVELSKYKGRPINEDNVAFLRELAAEYGDFSKKIMIGGLIGSKGDCYNPSEALSPEDSYDFHKTQIKALGQSGIDFLFAATMPALSEIKGIVKICSELKLPYVVSFMIRKDGKLLDGTFISDAITEIDKTADLKPLFYMVNCVHPANVLKALEVEQNDIEVIKKRLYGVQGNASAKSPEELDEKAELDADSPENLARAMAELKEKYGFRIFGGCCGTNESHVRAMADKIAP